MRQRAAFHGFGCTSPSGVSSRHSGDAAQNSTEASALTLTYSVMDCDLQADISPLPLCCLLSDGFITAMEKK